MSSPAAVLVPDEGGPDRRGRRFERWPSKPLGDCTFGGPDRIRGADSACTEGSYAMAPQELPPPLALLRMATGYYVSCAIHVAAKLGIADLMSEGPRHYRELAAATGTHAPSLHRVLRLLASVGVLAEGENGRIAVPPSGACLRSEGPGSMRAAALLFGGVTQQAWGDLLHSVTTGEPAFRRRFGLVSFSYMAQLPEDAASLGN